MKGMCLLPTNYTCLTWRCTETCRLCSSKSPHLVDVRLLPWKQAASEGFLLFWILHIISSKTTKRVPQIQSRNSIENTIPAIDSLPRPVDFWFLFDGRFDETATVLGRDATTLLLDTVETSMSLHCATTLLLDTVETSKSLHCVAPVGSEIIENSVWIKCLVWQGFKHYQLMLEHWGKCLSLFQESLNFVVDCTTLVS